MGTIQKQKFQIHDYDRAIESLLTTIKKELSTYNSELILKYDKVMVRESLAKATRRKHLEILFYAYCYLLQIQQID